MARWAAIFDWDGVICDSSAQHERSWELLAAEEGLPLPPGHFRRGFGKRNDTVIPHVLGWTRDRDEIARLARRKEALYRELVARDGIVPLPGVTEWLAALRGAEVPCAVASSTPRANLAVSLRPLRLEAVFAVLVCAEDVRRGKPHPDVFLTAAARLGVHPRQCVVFEDAHAGVAAGLAAGMRVVALSTTHPAHTLGDAHLVVPDLGALRLPDVARWFA